MATKAEIEGRYPIIGVKKGGKGDVDLTTTTINQFIANIQESLNQPNPSNRWFIFRADGQVKRQELNIVQQRALIEQVNNLGLMADTLANLEAKKRLIPEIIENIINTHRAEVEMNSRLHRHKLDLMEIERQTRQAEADKTAEEVEVLRQHRREKEARVNLMNKIGEMIDWSTIPDYAKPRIIDAIFGVKADTDIDSFIRYELKDVLKGAMEEEVRAGAMKQTAEARKANSQADLAEHSADQTIKSQKKYD